MRYVRTAPEPVRPAPPRPKRPALRSIVSGGANLLTTAIIVLFAIRAVPHLLSWAVTHGVWNGDGDACRDAGACWAFLRAKMPFILFGIYPEAERWRPILVVLILGAATLWSLPRAHWTRATLGLWGVAIVASLLLMAGGRLGLSPVPTSAWGGLPITMLLTIFSLALGFPLGIVLALARRSDMPVYRWTATALIEVMRAMPLVTLLFVASVMAPLLLPAGVTADNLTRALVAFVLSSSAYIAEVVRGGLQGVPPGQQESARALGLGRSTVLLSIILPQAIRKALAPLTSTVVVIIKNSSLVLVVGLFDLLSAGRVSLNDPAWPTPYAETYLVIALIYFVICYGFARYALHLERTTQGGEGRP